MVRIAVLVACLAGLAASNLEAADTVSEPLAKQLQAIRAAQRKDDAAAADRLTRELLPSEAEIRAALRPGVAKADMEKILKMHQQLSGAPKGHLAGLFKAEPQNTELAVHGATTEEIAKYEKGSVAFDEFPGAIRELAATHLKPGLRFYEAEFVKPGQRRGVKYHLFFAHEGKFRMLGPIWRSLGKK